ncbi:MAG: 3'-5' exoribonuclease YhaM family protein [Desulfobulbus sp.]|jgi:3'-5' exoribonuclease
MTAVVKHIFVANLSAGQQVRDIFLVARKTLAETKAGRPYLALTLMDRTGEIEARAWDNAVALAALADEGQYILVQGVVRPFREQMQLGIAGLQPVADQHVDPADFMPAGTRSPEEMAAELEATLAGIGDPPLQTLLRTLFQGETLHLFLRAPAAKKLHHAYIGGLAEHSLSVAAMAHRTAAQYPLVERDMLVAGALLHDLAKIEEFSFARPPFSYTTRGRLVGHLVLGAEMVTRAAAQVDGFPPDQLDRLVHMVLSHHGQYAYGAPVLPMTPEAIALHHLDDLDAKMHFMEEIRSKMGGTGWQWTDYQRHLERYLYLRAGGPPENTLPPDTVDGEWPSSEEEEPEPAPPPPKPDSRQQSLF